MLIAGIDIELIKKDIKNLHLAVYPPDGRVRLAVPDGINENTLEMYVISKLSWIRRQQRYFVKQNRQSPREFVNRETHYLFGRKYLLRVNELDSVKKPVIELKSKNHIDMTVSKDAVIDIRKKAMDTWYREQLRVILDELVPKWESILRVKTNTVKVYSMRTKWGSCNTDKKNIMFNVELAKKPVKCIEYVIVHELAHLLDKKHGDAFHAIMNRYLPNWRLLREELNELVME
jgi:predicted metal-dependent hydrolase